jgi:hypothetical protein
MWRRWILSMRLPTRHAAPVLPVDLLLRRAGVLDAILSSMPKHPNGTPGKKSPAN